MYTNPQRLDSKLTKELRNEAGLWLRDLREKRGLTQRDLAAKVGAKYYTFVSNLESGRGRIPPDRYLDWADALEIEPQEFVHRLMSYYDPVTFGILFGETPGRARPSTWPLSIGPAWLMNMMAMFRPSIQPRPRSPRRRASIASAKTAELMATSMQPVPAKTKPIAKSSNDKANTLAIRI